MQTLIGITLNTINDVKSFVNTANKFNGDVLIRNGHYIVDGKSLLGIFSLDLSKGLTVEFSNTPNEEILGELHQFIKED
jgi:phosphotransferase system HPr-like phosphotransfer protein